MRKLFNLSIVILLLSCSSSGDNTKQVQKFILEKETGFKWGTPLPDIFSEMNIKKDINVSKKDNQAISGWQMGAAIASDFISAFSGSEEVGEATAALENNVYQDGPIVICSPIHFIDIKFDNVYYRSYSCKGEKPMFQESTLDLIEYYKKYEEDMAEVSEKDFLNLKNYFSNVAQSLKDKNGNIYYTTQNEAIYLYKTIEQEGLIFKDDCPVIEVVIKPLH